MVDNDKDEKVEWQLQQVVAIIKNWILQKKVGSVQINLFQGGISNVNLKESVKLEDKIGS